MQDVFDWARQVINARATDKTMAAVPGAATPALTNVYLPGISGHEAIHLFIQHFPKVPVLMVSGLPDVDVIRKWRAEDGFGVFRLQLGLRERIIEQTFFWSPRGQANDLPAENSERMRCDRSV